MSSVRPNRQRYLVSLAEELHSQANRVRDLIGDAHWFLDGHHKEYLLLDLLSRHLPAGMLAVRGFVISPTDPTAVSTEQDILIVDTLQESPLFNQGGTIITFPRAVRAAVSVKTKMDNDNVRDSVAGLSTVRSLATGHTDPRAIWCGAYYFDLSAEVARDPNLVFGQIRRAIAASPIRKPITPQTHPHPLGPDIHCSAHELVFKLTHGYTSDAETIISPRICGYRSDRLATAFFLGDLLDHIASGRGAPEADFVQFSESDATQLLGEEMLSSAHSV